MLARIPIRWRIVLFHILTLLAIAVLLGVGMFAVFGIAVENSVEQLARSRAVDAARIVESTGSLTDADLAALADEGVTIVAIDGEGRVVIADGIDVAPGDPAPSDMWRTVLASGEGQGGEERELFTRWTDDASYTWIEPVRVDAPIRLIEASANYDQVGQSQFMWVTFSFVGFGVLAFILITFGSIHLVRYSLAPVKDIASAAGTIGTADLSRRLPVRSTRDELGYLASTFNDLLDRLEAAFNEREDTLRQQRRFVADASHELRTPLTSILGYTRMLRRWGMRDPDTSAEALAHLESEAHRMESLVSGLLQLAHGDEAGTLSIEPIDLGPVVRDAVANAQARAGSTPTLTAIIPDISVIAMADRDAVSQVVGILLDNAMKFAERRIDIDLTSEPDRAVIAVRDDGPGIAPEHQPHVFERFYRAEHSRTTQGTGLGLAIARDLVTRMQGTIALTSTPGKGATFSVRLPLAPVIDTTA